MGMRIRSAALAALATVVLFAAGCAGAHTVGLVRSVSPVAAPASAGASKAAVPRGVFAQIPGDNPVLTQAGGGAYLSWDLPQTGAGGPHMVLARIDTRTGTIEATNTFSEGFVSAPLFAAGALWVTDSTALGELLLRLDPVTLMVTSELKLSAGRFADGSHLTYAGGWLWADGGDRLLRVSPSSVELTGTVALRGAYRSNVGASPDGSVLVVSESGRTGAVQVRDPRTGALLASNPVVADEAAAIDGFTRTGVWVTMTTGSSAHAELLSISTMRPLATHPVSGPSDVRVRVADGRLWVTQDMAGDPKRNYCADARTARGLVPLPAASKGELLAVGGVLYYAEPARHGVGSRIAQVPIPAGCE